MIKIDAGLLQELGLSALPQQERDDLLKHIYETLEMRVGMRLADQMTNEQLDEFEQYFEAKDDAGAFAWLESNFPNYKDIVQEEFDKLKTEIGQSAPHILAASQAQAVPAETVQPESAPEENQTIHIQQNPNVGPAGPYIPQAPTQQPPAGPQSN